MHIYTVYCTICRPLRARIAATPPGQQAAALHKVGPAFTSVPDMHHKSYVSQSYEPGADYGGVRREMDRYSAPFNHFQSPVPIASSELKNNATRMHTCSTGVNLLFDELFTSTMSRVYRRESFREVLLDVQLFVVNIENARYGGNRNAPWEINTPYHEGHPMGRKICASLAGSETFKK